MYPERKNKAEEKTCLQNCGLLTHSEKRGSFGRLKGAWGLPELRQWWRHQLIKLQTPAAARGAVGADNKPLHLHPSLQSRSSSLSTHLQHPPMSKPSLHFRSSTSSILILISSFLIGSLFVTLVFYSTSSILPSFFFVLMCSLAEGGSCSRWSNLMTHQHFHLFSCFGEKTMRGTFL